MRLQSLCKACNKVAQREWYHRKATKLIREHIETWRLIGVHRAMDVFPDRCHYHFGTANPCMDDHVPGSTYCAKHRDSEALVAKRLWRQGRGDDEPPDE